MIQREPLTQYLGLVHWYIIEATCWQIPLLNCAGVLLIINNIWSATYRCSTRKQKIPEGKYTLSAHTKPFLLAFVPFIYCVSHTRFFLQYFAYSAASYIAFTAAALVKTDMVYTIQLFQEPLKAIFP